MYSKENIPKIQATYVDKSKLETMSSAAASTNAPADRQGVVEQFESSCADPQENPSEAQSFLIIPPPPSTSEDTSNDNVKHLVLARIVDGSVWQSSEGSDSQAETINSSSTTALSEMMGSCVEIEAMESKKDRGVEPSDIKVDERASENSSGEPRRINVIAEWPRTNTDFELLTKLDDETATADMFFADHSDESDIFDPKDWFVQPDLSDDDVSPGRRLRMNPGRMSEYIKSYLEFSLTPIDSWTLTKETLLKSGETPTVDIEKN